jgi:hypothetical protein
MNGLANVIERHKRFTMSALFCAAKIFVCTCGASQGVVAYFGLAYCAEKCPGFDKRPQGADKRSSTICPFQLT